MKLTKTAWISTSIAKMLLLLGDKVPQTPYQVSVFCHIKYLLIIFHECSGVAWHGPSRALARPLEMLLGPRWGQGPTFNILISGSALWIIYYFLELLEERIK